jgi:hypothetical protein
MWFFSQPASGLQVNADQPGDNFTSLSVAEWKMEIITIYQVLARCLTQNKCSRNVRAI